MRRSILLCISSISLMFLISILLSVVIDNPWDINRDNTVDKGDLNIVADCFGRQMPVNCPYNPDVNQDGIVDILDLVSVGQHYGETYPNPNADDDPIVYITETGTKYHRAGCRFLKQSAIPIKKSEAIKQGYTPCSVCKP